MLTVTRSHFTDAPAQAGAVSDMMSNLTIGEGDRASRQPAPQTQAPAVTRRSTFHTDKEEEPASGILEEGPSEMTAQDR